MHTIGQVNNELGMRLQVQGPHPLLCGPPSSDAGEAFYSWGFVGFECTSQQKLDTKNKNFFRFNPKFGQLRIVHDTVVVLSTLRNKLVALH